MKKLLLLCGGRSDEHEISLISAKGILDALDRTQFDPFVVGIAKSGEWYWEEEKSFYTGEFRADKIALNTQRPTVSIHPFSVDKNRAAVLVEGKRYDFDVVFPVLHGPYGEDGTIQGLLDTIGVPYVGSGCGSSWICMDKALTKTLCEREGIPVSPFVVVNGLYELAKKEAEIKALGETLFVKPSRLGSSVGISKVTSFNQLSQAVETALKFDSKVVIEKGINGRELETAVLGLPHQAKVAVPGEVIPSKKIGWYSYEAKYLLSDGAETLIPAKLDPATVIQIQKFALRVFDVLECSGMARIDLFLENDTEKLYLNEANTIPGFTPISMYPKMWQASGLKYQDLITQLLQLAFEKKGL